MIIKRLFIFIVVELIVLIPFSSFATRFALPPAAPELPSDAIAGYDSVLAIDLKSGSAIINHNSAMQMHQTGISAHLMTALIAYETLGADASVTINDEMLVTANVSKLFLEAGDVWPVSSLITGMILRGAQDASKALAVACAGSEALFLEQMNQKAAALGMESTRYANALGGYDQAQVSTLQDLSLLAMQFQGELYALATTPKLSLDNGDLIASRLMLTSSARSSYDERILGAGMGYTRTAGANLILFAESGDMRALVLTYSNTLSDDTAQREIDGIIDYCFGSFARVDLTSLCQWLAPSLNSNLFTYTPSAENITLLVGSEFATELSTAEITNYHASLADDNNMTVFFNNVELCQVQLVAAPVATPTPTPTATATPVPTILTTPSATEALAPTPGSSPSPSVAPTNPRSLGALAFVPGALSVAAIVIIAVLLRRKPL